MKRTNPGVSEHMDYPRVKPLGANGSHDVNKVGRIIKMSFKPSPPGDTILDILEERKISRLQFEQIIGLSEGSVDDLISGDLCITPNVATRLSETLGSTPEFWMNREKDYRIEMTAMTPDQPKTVQNNDSPQKTEWVCRGCDDTECHFTVNYNAKIIFPIRCPLNSSGYAPKWIRIEPTVKITVPAFLDQALNVGSGVYSP
jgi:plasmid maintenance system antidote protein VapI